MMLNTQGLGELKEDMRRKDQELKQCRKQAMQFEFQRKSLQANLRDAEDALRTAAKWVLFPGMVSQLVMHNINIFHSELDGGMRFLGSMLKFEISTQICHLPALIKYQRLSLWALIPTSWQVKLLTSPRFVHTAHASPDTVSYTHLTLPTNHRV